jgi:hypothetical protein
MTDISTWPADVIVGRWVSHDGKEEFIAWCYDRPGLMHDMFTERLTLGRCVEILEYIHIPFSDSLSDCAMKHRNARRSTYVGY